MERIHSLSLRLVVLLFVAALSGSLLFGIMHPVGNRMIEVFLDNSEYEVQRMNARVTAFQKYVDRERILSTDHAAIQRWCAKQPLILMELYRNNKLLFSSVYSDSEDLADLDVDAAYYDWYSYYKVSFLDGPAELLVYSDEAYYIRVIISIVEIVLSMLMALVLFLWGIRRIVRDIRLLYNDVQILEGGNLIHPITSCGSDELGMLAQGLESMRVTFLEHRQNEDQLYRDNHAMITSLSHDLRTPLTRLKLYAEILRTKKYQDVRQEQECMDRINENIDRIQQLSDNILQYSLLPGERVEEKLETMELKKALYSPLLQMTEYLEQQGFHLRSDLNWDGLSIYVYEPFIERLLDNISSNIEKYAEPSSPVLLALWQDNAYTVLSVQNVIRQDEGTPTGTRIGLQSVQSMMRQMRGLCYVEQTSKTFSVELWFTHGAR